MRRRKKSEHGARNAFFIVMIVILSFVLVIQIIYIVSELNESWTRYHADEADYLRQVTYENYYRILDNAIEDCEIDREYSERETEIRALGYYYEAASLSKAYETIGDAHSAAKQKKRMEGFRQDAGSYAGETDKIDALLGISKG